MLPLQCLIDLQRNLLIIGTTGTTTPFLPESELPVSARLTGNSEESMEQQAIADAIEQSKREGGGGSGSGGTGSGGGGGGGGAGAGFSGASGSGTGTGTTTAGSAITAGGGPNTIQPFDHFTEQDVTDLMELGFQRGQVLTALRVCNGNKQQASSVLLSGGGGFS